MAGRRQLWLGGILPFRCAADIALASSFSAMAGGGHGSGGHLSVPAGDCRGHVGRSLSRQRSLLCRQLSAPACGCHCLRSPSVRSGGRLLVPAAPIFLLGPQSALAAPTRRTTFLRFPRSVRSRPAWSKKRTVLVRVPSFLPECLRDVHSPVRLWNVYPPVDLRNVYSCMRISSILIAASDMGVPGPKMAAAPSA